MSKPIIRAENNNNVPVLEVNTPSGNVPVLPIESTGAEPVLESKSITENGTYTPEEGVDGFDEVVVNVPQTTVTSISITENGTYNAPTGSAYSPVVVNVPIPSERVVSEYNFTTSMEDLIRPNVNAVGTRGNTPSIDGLIFDHNFCGIYPNYSFQPMKDYIIEISIGDWTIQPPTSTFNNRFIGLDYKSYFGVSGTTGMYLGYLPILTYDRTLDTPAWTVVNQTSENYFANKTFYIKLQNYYDSSTTSIKIRVLYSEDGEIWTNTNRDFIYVDSFYTLNIGSDVTKTNTDASTIKDFYLKKLKITEIDTNIII